MELFTRRKGKANGSSARLKHAIDSGDTGDKVPGFDPAAAPLGTDAEAAGTPPGEIAVPNVPANREQAAEMAADPAGTDRAGYSGQDRFVWAVVVGAVAIAAVAAASALFLG
jgi:hypothetical protein